MRSSYNSPHRPRSVWFALGTGGVLSLCAVLFVLLPLLALIGASAGAAWFVPVPAVQIGVAVAAGYLLALGLLVLLTRQRRGPIAWILAVAAVIATLVVSIYPAVAVSLAAVGRVGDVIPWITGWFQRS